MNPVCPVAQGKFERKQIRKHEKMAMQQSGVGSLYQTMTMVNSAANDVSNPLDRQLSDLGIPQHMSGADPMSQKDRR